MAIVRKDKIASGYNGNLEHVKVYNTAGALEVETTNGVFVVVEGLLVGEREVKKARLGAKADATKEVLLVHNSEVMADESKKLDEFVIAEGKVARAYYLTNGDIVTLTADLFSGTVAVGDELVILADGKIGKDATVANAKIKFLVIEDSGNELHITKKAYAVQVVR